jgi:hypothetical protein
MFKTYKNIDYLKVTWKGQQYPESVLPMHDGFEPGDRMSGGTFYETAYRLKCGGMYGYSEDEKQGIIVILSGEPLRNLREAGFSNEKMVKWALTGRNVPRLDYAVDVIGGTAKDHSPESLRSAYMRGKIKTRLKLDTSHKDEEIKGGRTIKFGSDKSERQVVVYDKGGQLRLLEEAWTRIEMKVKNEFGKTLAADMDRAGVAIAGDATLRKLFNPDVPWVQDALDQTVLELGEVPRKEKNFRNWLNTTVLSSIRNNLDTEQQAIKDFVIAVLDMLPGGS